ncbi:MAG: hypothetical protein IPM29_03070 [Planctomycetes bacterium]|nr:hypothetical protein [Planctomycetota bacterium]
MVRPRRVIALFAVFLGASPSAQSIAGDDDRSTRPNTEVDISPIPTTPPFLGSVPRNGQPIEGDAFVLTPHIQGAYQRRNARGHTGRMTPLPDGSFRNEVLAGPHTGQARLRPPCGSRASRERSAPLPIVSHVASGPVRGGADGGPARQSG